jgi:hypothetical protein
MVPAQWLLLEGWAVVVPLFVGWGALVRWLWREPVRSDAGDVLLSFWLGWAAVLLVLQLAHFAVPIDARARALIVGGGVLGLLSAWRPWWRLVRRLPRAIAALAVGALLAIWLSNRAAGGLPSGDTGTYYLPTIRWVSAHPLVVGLANLYAPYGYNLSYFLYAALLDAGPFAGRTHHLLNSTLLAVLTARTLLGLWRVLRRRATSSAVDVFYALMLPAEAQVPINYLFTSPAPDLAVYMLGIVLSGELIALMVGPRREQRLHFLALALLTALAPTVKLPLLGLAAPAIVAGIAVWIGRTRQSRRTTVAGLALAASFGALAVGPWIAGNVLLSGYPFFPSAIGALPVAWRVDWDVQQWIRDSMPISNWQDLLRDPSVWQRMVALGWTDPGVVVPACIALAALFLALARAVVPRTRGMRRDGPSLPAVALLPPSMSLIFCMLTTPVPRYFGATIWLLAAQSVMVLLGNRLLAPVVQRSIALGAVALAALPFAATMPGWLDVRDFPPSPRPVIATRRLPSGLEVYVPISTNPLCWDAPLPCTPRPHPGLRLRHPPDLGSGFEIEPGTGPPPPFVRRH